MDRKFRKTVLTLSLISFISALGLIGYMFTIDLKDSDLTKIKTVQFPLLGLIAMIGVFITFGISGIVKVILETKEETEKVFKKENVLLLSELKQTVKESQDFIMERQDVMDKDKELFMKKINEAMELLKNPKVEVREVVKEVPVEVEKERKAEFVKQNPVITSLEIGKEFEPATVTVNNKVNIDSKPIRSLVDELKLGTRTVEEKKEEPVKKPEVASIEDLLGMI